MATEKKGGGLTLKIRETAWGIDRAAGGRRERVSANASIPCAVGDITDFGKGRRHFRIEAVSADGIRLSVSCADPRYDRSWELKRGEEAVYRPRSFDGGYYYTFRLI